jgi:hypothetical protein
VGTTRGTVVIVRDVRCMSCSRMLGRWVIVNEQRQGMLPPRKGEPIMVSRSGGGLRCKHCQGRAYLDEPEPGDLTLQALLESE